MVSVSLAGSALLVALASMLYAGGRASVVIVDLGAFRGWYTDHLPLRRTSL